MVEILLYISLFCRLTLIITFAYSFLGKVGNMQEFMQTVKTFALVPPFLNQLSAWVFLIGELAALLCLLLGYDALKIGFILAAFLLSMFSVALAIAISRHSSIYCNCFGKSEHVISRADILRNMGFIMCASLGLLIVTIFGEPPNPSLTMIITAGFASIVFTAFLLSIKDLAIFFAASKTKVLPS